MIKIVILIKRAKIDEDEMRGPIRRLVKNKQTNKRGNGVGIL